MEFEPHPDDLRAHRLATLLRRPEVVIPYLAKMQAADRAGYDRDNPPVRWDPGMGMPRYELPFRRDEADAAMGVGLTGAGLAMPGVAPGLSRAWGGLQALRHAYNSRAEQAFGPNQARGYYGQGQAAFDGATAHGEGDPLFPLMRALGLTTEAAPEPRHGGSLWDILGIQAP